MPNASALRVLLVEDEPATRAMLARMLERLACDVLAVGTGAEALRAVEAGVPLDALVVETSQAHAGRRSVARAVARRWPRARLVFTARTLPDLLPDAVNARVLVKPLTARDLAEALGRGQPR